VRKGRIIAQRDKESMGRGVQAQDLGDVALNLCRMTKSLRCWSFYKFDAVTKELENIKRKIEELNDQNHVENQVEIGRLSTRMKELLYREEMMCLQWSRITWLKEGDQNTKFFHRKVIERGKKNKIELLRKYDGMITKNMKEMEGMKTFFSKTCIQPTQV
jgi:tRNA U34 5-carboxymethylaminomethyl modifying enzyme MnmG/GidA